GMRTGTALTNGSKSVRSTYGVTDCAASSTVLSTMNSCEPSAPSYTSIASIVPYGPVVVPAMYRFPTTAALNGWVAPPAVDVGGHLIARRAPVKHHVVHECDSGAVAADVGVLGSIVREQVADRGDSVVSVDGEPGRTATVH